MFEDLKLTNGDITFSNLGQLVFASDKESISQSITNRLNTIKGELFYNLKYGINIDFARVKRMDKYKNQLEFYIKDALIYDTRIAGVALVDLTKVDKDKFTASLKILLTNNTVLEFNYQF
jgi:hypothetical protein